MQKPAARESEAEEKGNDAEAAGEGRPIEPLSDYYEEGGPTHYPEHQRELHVLLEHLLSPRDQNQEIDPSRERERLAEGLEGVTEALRAERDVLRGARAELGAAPAAEGDAHTPQTTHLEEAKEKIETELKKVGLAEEYHDVLETLSTMDADGLQSVMETGLTKEGRKLKSKRHRELSLDEAKHLASLAKAGVRRLTWGAFNKILQLFDAVLTDLLAPFVPFKRLKQMLGLGGK